MKQMILLRGYNHIRLFNHSFVICNKHKIYKSGSILVNHLRTVLNLLYHKPTRNILPSHCSTLPTTHIQQHSGIALIFNEVKKKFEGI